MEYCSFGIIDYVVIIFGLGSGIYLVELIVGFGFVVGKGYYVFVGGYGGQDVGFLGFVVVIVNQVVGQYYGCQVWFYYQVVIEVFYYYYGINGVVIQVVVLFWKSEIEQVYFGQCCSGFWIVVLIGGNEFVVFVEVEFVVDKLVQGIVQYLLFFGKIKIYNVFCLQVKYELGDDVVLDFVGIVED